jgi:hypothetical protein
MTDHKWWGAPEVFPNVRPAFKIDAQHPGSDLASEVAASLAASSMLFKGSNPAYAAELIKHAKELYQFADKYRGLYHEAIPDVVDFYKSWSGYTDELVWGALWLYIATGEKTYLTKAESLYGELPKEPQSTTPKFKEALSWDDKTYGCYVLLAKLTNKQQYHTDVQRWLDWWSHGYSVRLSGGKSWSTEEGIQYTPGGLAWVRQWGPIRYAANTAFLAFVYSDCKDVPAKKKEIYYKWAKSQIDYALGNNELKRSYVCGFGVNPPTKPHHRSMHGPWLDDNGRTPVNSRHVLYGALVGGPGSDGSFEDARLDAVKNEVATDYNAGFSSALARLAKDFNGKIIDDFPAPAVRDTEYVVVAKINNAGDRFTEISATVMNRTTWPARFSNKLTMRYFVNLSEVLAAGYSANDILVVYKACTLCKDTLQVSQLKQYGADSAVYFTEISFDGESIFPGGQSQHRREVQFRISLPDTAPRELWDPSNDPSYKGLTTMIDTTGCENITVYENGVLVWGKEPNGTSFIVSKWQKPVFNEPDYKASRWNLSMFEGCPVIRTTDTRSNNKTFVVEKNPGGLTINVFQECQIGVFDLRGRRVYSISLPSGASHVIKKSKLSESLYVIRMTVDEVTYTSVVQP